MTLPRPEVRVIRSARRRKTIAARLEQGVVVVRAPQHLSGVELDAQVEALVDKVLRRQAATEIDLPSRAAAIAKRHDLPEPTEIRFVSNQHHRWGSCTPATGVIRISDRLASVPGWVLDHVILHELAHLVTPGHGPQFHAIVDGSPKAERAEGFLEGLSHARHATPPPADPAG